MLLEEALVELRVVRDEQRVAGEGQEAAARPPARAAPTPAPAAAGRSGARPARAGRSPGSRATGTSRPARARARAPRRARRSGRAPARGRWSRGRRRRTPPPRATDRPALRRARRCRRRRRPGCRPQSARRAASTRALPRSPAWRRATERPRRPSAGRVPRACRPAGRASRAQAAPVKAKRTYVRFASQSGKSGIACRSRPSSTARVTAAEPKRSRTSSSAASSASVSCSNGSIGWNERPSPRFPTETPTSVIPRLRDQRPGEHQQRAGGVEDRPRAGGRVGQRVRARRAREVVEAESQHDRPAGPPGHPHPSRDAVDKPGEGRIHVLERGRSTTKGTLRADRPPPAPRPHGPRIAVARQGVELPPGRAAEQPDEHVLSELGDLADRGDPEGVQPPCRHRADAPEPLDLERVQECELMLGRHHEQPVGLGDPARHLGEELRPGHADRDRQADPLAHLASQQRGDRRRRAGQPADAAGVEKGLVDREPFDPRREVVEDAGTRPCSPGSRRPSAARPRSRPGRGGERGRRSSPCGRRAPSPRSSPPAPPRSRRSPAGRAGAVVALLDRREEGIEIRVQDRGLARHEHMFAENAPPRNAFRFSMGRTSVSGARAERTLAASRSRPADDHLARRRRPAAERHRPRWRGALAAWLVYFGQNSCSFSGIGRSFSTDRVAKRLVRRAVLADPATSRRRSTCQSEESPNPMSPSARR